MKTIILLIAVLIPTLAASQSFVETQFTSSQGEITPSIEMWIQEDLGGGLGWFAWSMNSQDWAEAYAGVSYTPFPWCQTGIGVGVETANPCLRWGGFL